MKIVVINLFHVRWFKTFTDVVLYSSPHLTVFDWARLLMLIWFNLLNVFKIDYIFSSLLKWVRALIIIFAIRYRDVHQKTKTLFFWAARSSARVNRSKYYSDNSAYVVTLQHPSVTNGEKSFPCISFQFYLSTWERPTFMFLNIYIHYLK